MEPDPYSAERHAFPPVREGYDRVAIDAYLGDLATEMEALRQTSGELHTRLRALGDELQALTLRLRAGTEQPLVSPVESAAAGVSPPAEKLTPPAPASATAQNSDVRGAAGARPEADLDGARLVALNMALEGHPRERADSYLAERFQLADRAKLLDEVYAAIEG